MLQKGVPTFSYNAESEDIFENPVIEEIEFFERLLDFIETNLLSTYNTTLLCYLVDRDGNMSEATLEPEGYYKSLLKCKDFFEQEERYEECKKIKSLIEEYGLQ